MQGHQEITADRLTEFITCGYAQRHFFPHQTFRVPKGGPDGFRLARRMCGAGDPAQLREILLYATGPALDEFPQDLFFDDDLVWHQQQFGLPGHIASATLVLDGDRLFAITLVSDIVQRIARRREHKTRIEKLFRGWPYMLWNSILVYAAEIGARQVLSPDSGLVLENTDRRRSPKPALYSAIYDRPPQVLGATHTDRWWRLDMPSAEGRMVQPAKMQSPSVSGQTICLCHDIEYGYGHTVADPDFAVAAHKDSAVHVDRMLAIEKEMGVKATYQVVGQLVPGLRDKIERDGHCLAFHSYDHGEGLDQLLRCRQVDYRLKGYRVPQSRLTEELTDANLSFHNFEWLASSARTFGFAYPRMENSVVKIPVLFDDFPLYRHGMNFVEWERQALERIEQNDFAAFGMHDCYAHFWLPGYRRFLEKLSGMGTLKTLNQVAAEITLGTSS